MATLGTIDKGTCYLVSQIIGLLQGPDLHVPGVTRGDGKCVCNGAPAGHPFKCEGT